MVKLRLKKVERSINDKIEGVKVKNIVKNDNLLYVHGISKNYSVEQFNQIYKCIIDNEMNIKNLVNSSNENLDISFTIPKDKFTKFADLIEKELPDLDCTYNEISRISIIGNGIMSNNVVLKKVVEILNNANVDILSMEMNESRISVMFKEIISNTILEQLHEKLI